MFLLKKIALILLLNVPLYSIAQNNMTRDSIDEKIQWYNSKKDYSNLIKYTIQKAERDGLDTVALGRISANNMIYGLIFAHSNDTIALQKGLHWIKTIIDTENPTPEHIDTYANLLYKTGKNKEAILWETKAVALSPNDPGLQETLEKMKSNIPTWAPVAGE